MFIQKSLIANPGGRSMCRVRELSVNVISLAMLCASVSTPAYGVDGVIEINQARALAGGVTTGDTAGFPVTISAGGSYRLTGELAPANPNSDAIVITSNDWVRIDLNGFSIKGPGSCTGCPVTSCTGGTGAGVRAVASTSVVELVYGAIRGMGSDGVHMDALPPRGHLQIYHVHIEGNGGRGVYSDASFSVIHHISSQANGGVGLRALRGTFDSNIARCNGAGGIEAGNGSQLFANSVESNGGTGIFANTRSLVQDNTVESNGGAGISVAANSTVKSNTISNNTAQGIYAVDGSLVQGNLVTDNGSTGVVAFTKGSVSWNTLSGNGTSVSSGKAFSLGAQVSYSQNTLSNHGSNPACQAVIGGVEMLHNICDGVASCVMPYCPSFDPVCGPCIP